MTLPSSIYLPDGKALFNAGKMVVTAEECCCGEAIGESCEYCEAETPLRLKATIADVVLCDSITHDTGSAWEVLAWTAGPSVSANGEFQLDQTEGDPCYWLYHALCTGTIAGMAYSIWNLGGSPISYTITDFYVAFRKTAASKMMAAWYYTGGASFLAFEAVQSPALEEDCWSWTQDNQTDCDTTALQTREACTEGTMDVRRYGT